MAESNRWRTILLFGMPGSGKGTQGKALGAIPGYLHIASGEIFRQISRFGQLGRQVSSYTSEGKLVPDELTIEIWRHHMNLLVREGEYRPNEQVIILDGIPRTHRQAEILAADLDILTIFYLKLNDEEEAVQRIRARALKENRSDDADERVIRGRLATFHRQTADTLRYYDPTLIDEIDAARRPMQVLCDMVQRICRTAAEMERSTVSVNNPHP